MGATGFLDSMPCQVLLHLRLFFIRLPPNLAPRDLDDAHRLVFLHCDGLRAISKMVLASDPVEDTQPNDDAELEDFGFLRKTKQRQGKKQRHAAKKGSVSLAPDISCFSKLNLDVPMSTTAASGATATIISRQTIILQVSCFPFLDWICDSLW
jgi:hypothetical protein